MMLEVYGRTETGPVRSKNEDHVLIAGMICNSGTLSLQMMIEDKLELDRGRLLAVSDGIGGCPSGATASRLALTHLDHIFSCSDGPLTNRLLLAAKAANEALLDAGRAQPELAGMGCTLAGICVTSDGYIVFHAGDSRVYRYRDGVLKMLTLDDTEPGLAVRAGHLTVAAAARHPRRHILTNSVGSAVFSLAIQTGPVPRAGDVVMICSDGLHDFVQPTELEDMFVELLPNITVLGDRLVDSAIENGGHDNVSLILHKFGAPSTQHSIAIAETCEGIVV